MSEFVLALVMCKNMDGLWTRIIRPKQTWSLDPHTIIRQKYSDDYMQNKNQ